MGIDKAKLDKAARTAAARSSKHIKKEEWRKVEQYKEWVFESAGEYTIAVLVEVIISEGIKLSARSLFPVISKWTKQAKLEKNASKDNEARLPVAKNTPIDPARSKTHGNNLPSKSSSAEGDKPWKDPKLSPEERESIQAAHVLNDDSHIWKTEV